MLLTIPFMDISKGDSFATMARNNRLLERLHNQLKKARTGYPEDHRSKSLYKDFTYRTLGSCSRSRRGTGKVEYVAKGEKARFIVTNLLPAEIAAGQLYEDVYCVGGDTENQVKEQQLYLFSDRTSTGAVAILSPFTTSFAFSVPSKAIG
jgi:hypothetical protein